MGKKKTPTKKQLAETLKINASPDEVVKLLFKKSNVAKGVNTSVAKPKTH